jgi:hemoglobin-like flavoprotein
MRSIVTGDRGGYKAAIPQAACGTTLARAGAARMCRKPVTLVIFAAARQEGAQRHMTFCNCSRGRESLRSGHNSEVLMTETQVQLINRSFAGVLPISDAASTIFYNRLFELQPGVRGLFRSDMQEQGRKLMHTIGTAVGAARNLDALRAPLQELAKRHARYGVQPEHFEDVGAALLYTLEKGLGPAFTAETREAWAALYGEIVTIMRPALASAHAGEPGPGPRHAARAHAPRERRPFLGAVLAWFKGQGR